MSRRLDEKRHFLFVEGIDDGVVVNALVRSRLDIDLTAQGGRVVQVGQGWQGAIDRFKLTARGLADRRVGLLVDRDGAPEQGDRLPSVLACLRDLGYSPPEMLPSAGWWVPGHDGGRIGTWLMPDNTGHGDLETFLEDLLPEDRRLFDFAGSATTEARGYGATYSLLDRRKAHLHAYSAWLDEPGGGYGRLIQANALRTRSSSADAFISWFEQLFLK